VVGPVGGHGGAAGRGFIRAACLSRHPPPTCAEIPALINNNTIHDETLDMFSLLENPPEPEVRPQDRTGGNRADEELL